jgi:hypothetical protein
MRVSVQNAKKLFQIPVLTVRPSSSLPPMGARLGLGALPIMQLKELEVDHERYHAWKASLRKPKRHAP